MLSIAQAAAGVDPMASARKALRMDPLKPLTRQAVEDFQSSTPADRARRARVVRAAAIASNDLSIVPSLT